MTELPAPAGRYVQEEVPRVRYRTAKAWRAAGSSETVQCAAPPSTSAAMGSPFSSRTSKPS